MTPAGLYRKDYGFMRWADFDEALLNRIREEANAKIRNAACSITASDIDARSLNICRRNIESAGMKDQIKTQLSAFERLPFPPAPGFIIANPPYGERLRPFDLVALYKAIGDTLKRNCPGYGAWILGSDAAALKYIGLKPARKLTVFNGPLECRFCRFDVFSGSRREHLAGNNA
jgi:putative N6-adenine-specific DNA methylase